MSFYRMSSYAADDKYIVVGAGSKPVFTVRCYFQGRFGTVPCKYANRMLQMINI